ncbi:HD domain-containing phosphohydrolase [Vibrio tubiashii]|uniref:Chemotactic transducer-related protein n=1 Tax=Vibrio tubiashii ATCC 19109 TaxID=1051646 RepID=F9T3E3_9VIBR|nr:HD domain-containing phosphohydrolase [Vibrio tubiashii]AIW15914.1 chemotaxis protein [Vibrio tubiashii ATCC 19109]EGU57127.1 chemotactic transducer-related protein [Vibrio tubiashii ATCC 19109]EIF03308.1 chemotactic transducer-related protein [Vibrio tubiashii NCIMB 1337 = ATCC 19106]
MNSPKLKKQPWPLWLYFSCYFSGLTLLIGAILVVLSDYHTNKLLSKNALDLSHNNRLKIESSFQLSMSPVVNTLDLISSSSLIQSTILPAQEQEWLYSIKETFERLPYLTSLYYASDKGTFTILRPVTNDAERERLGAPENSTFMLGFTNMQGVRERQFYSSTLTLLSSKVDQPEVRFDARSRPWFISALSQTDIQLTEPYRFYRLGSYGVTLSRRSYDGQHIIAADTTLSNLSTSMQSLMLSEATQLVLLDSQMNILAHQGLGWDERMPFIEPEKLQTTIFNRFTQPVTSPAVEEVEWQGESWIRTLTPVTLDEEITLYLAEATPRRILLADILSLRKQQIITSLMLLILGTVAVWRASLHLSSPIKSLAQKTYSISQFSFNKNVYCESHILEINELNQAIKLMENTISDLLALLAETAKSVDIDEVIERLLKHCATVTQTELVTMLVVEQNEQQKYQFVKPEQASIASTNNWQWIQQRIQSPEIQANLSKPYTIALGASPDGCHWFLFPIHDKSDQLIRVLLIGYDTPPGTTQTARHPFVRQLIKFAAIAAENIVHVKERQAFLEAIPELLASAIDTKSPYTSGHCQRVPYLTEALTQALENNQEQFANFRLDKEEWEALRLAGWLHDCGKITTPEFVVDKATKLETLYDRIHEVRMRFELLKQEAHTHYWQTLAGGGEQQEAIQQRDETLQQLDEEFEFVARCNLGSEWMDDAALARLDTIAQRTWTRTLSDRIGISWLELSRHGESQETLPVTESLLADKPVHLVPWVEGHYPPEQWTERYNLVPSPYQYNRGERHNLAIRAGTLNSEERFMINDHIIQTQRFLSALPLPHHLREVPDIAGNHHERIDGRGYPRGLSGDQLSIPARVMALADVFEALTSSDRPYKKAKSLTEAHNIMLKMATSGHLDPDIYLVMLENKLDIYYAKKFLLEEQQSEVDRNALIEELRQHIAREAS